MLRLNSLLAAMAVAAMNLRPRSHSIAPRGVFGMFMILMLTSSLSARSQMPITYLYTGEITGVDDQYNWFNSSYAVGGTVNGFFTYYDSGYRQGIYFGYPDTKAYLFSPGSGHSPDLLLQSDAHVVHEPVSLGVSVTNNGTHPFPPVSGDTVELNFGFYSLPAIFNDPTNTPGFEDYLADPFAFFLFNDPTGTALASNNLPLGNLNLSAFSTVIGRIGITDGNGDFDEAAIMNFRFTSLQAVPEPGIAMLLAGCMASAGIVFRRKVTPAN